MSLKDRYDFDSLVNETERFVLAELETQLSAEKGVCTCQDCVLDMAAYAMNNVRPAYRVSLMGSVYARAGGESQQAQEIRRSVRDAIQKVRTNPSHD
jgi:competence protein ComFB